MIVSHRLSYDGRVFEHPSQTFAWPKDNELKWEWIAEQNGIEIECGHIVRPKIINQSVFVYGVFSFWLFLFIFLLSAFICMSANVVRARTQACMGTKNEIIFICLLLSFFRLHAVAQWCWMFFYFSFLLLIWHKTEEANQMNQCQNCDGISRTHNLWYPYMRSFTEIASGAFICRNSKW